MALTISEIRAAKAIGKDLLLGDGGGLWLRVSPTGRKSWIARLHFQGKQEKKVLGEWPTMSPSDARDEVKRLRHQLQTTGTLKDQPSTVKTLDALAESYIEATRQTLAASTHAELERIVRKHLIPAFKDKLPEEVKRRDALGLIESLTDVRGTARQVMKTARAFFNWLIEREEAEANPFQNLSRAVPQIRPGSRERVLTEEEIRHVWHTLTAPSFKTDSDSTRRALLLILVTGQRPGEVSEMQYGEIKGDWWHLPAEKVKNRKAHSVFLTDLAKSLITPPPEIGPAVSVFPSPRSHFLREPLDKKHSHTSSGSTAACTVWTSPHTTCDGQHPRTWHA